LVLKVKIMRALVNSDTISIAKTSIEESEMNTKMGYYITLARA
jgi:hypothetical protein